MPDDLSREINELMLELIEDRGDGITKIDFFGDGEALFYVKSEYKELRDSIVRNWMKRAEVRRGYSIVRQGAWLGIVFNSPEFDDAPVRVEFHDEEEYVMMKLTHG